MELLKWDKKFKYKNLYFDPLKGFYMFNPKYLNEYIYLK